MLEGALLSDDEEVSCSPTVLLTQDPNELLRRPHVGRPLDAVGVCVEGGGEAGLLGPHLTDQPVHALADDPFGECAVVRSALGGTDPSEVGVDPQQ